MLNCVLVITVLCRISVASLLHFHRKDFRWLYPLPVPVVLILFTLPPVPFGIQRRYLSRGKSHSSACAWSGVSERPPPDRTPLLQECRGKTCPVGGDRD